MKKTILLIILYPVLVFSECEEGMKVISAFDQGKALFEIEQARTEKICTWVTSQLNANLIVQYLMDEKVIFEHQILIPLSTIHDLPKDNGDLSTLVKQEVSRRIINIPVQRNQVNRYRALHLQSKKLLGQGLIP